MKAWQIASLGKPWDQLDIVERPSPDPDPGMVTIRVEATDLNFADILQSEGKYQIKHEPPFTPGMNTTGVVVKAGADQPFVEGDRLVGPTVAPSGGYAEEAVLLAERSHRVPDALSPIDAMGVHVTYGTTWFAYHHRGNLKPGETVLVLAAAGGVGSAAVKMARAHGCWVVAAAGGEKKAEVCRDLGADLVIDYNAEDLYERVMEATDKRGVDVVYDPVGGKYFDIARRLVAFEGRLLVVGFASGDIPSAPANHMLVKNYSIVGVHMGIYREKDPALVRRCYEDLHAALVERRIEPFVSEVIGFEELKSGLLKLFNRQTVGRVVFDPTR